MELSAAGSSKGFIVSVMQGHLLIPGYGGGRLPNTFGERCHDPNG